MPNKHATGAHSTVIRCPNCGEDYSITYKRCPFCDEKNVQTSRRKRGAEDDYEEPAYVDEELDQDEDNLPRGGGKRLAGSGPKRRGGGYTSGGWSPLRVAGTVVSLAVIAAAVWIVVTQIMPLVSNGKPDPTPPSTAVITPSAEPTPSETLPGVLPTGEPEETQAPEASPSIPSTQTATGFQLNREDFTLAKPGETWDLKPTFLPEGSVGFLTWSVDKPSVATVSETGVVTAVSKGSATITATLAGGVSKTCVVRVNSGTAPSGTGSESSTPSGSASLNHTDFSFSSVNDVPVQMKVKGASGDPIWAIGDTSVATISGSGVVKPVGKGTTTITCTVDGQTLKCIVRCSFS